MYIIIIILFQLPPYFGGSSAEIIGWLEECREDGGCGKCVEGE